MPIKNARAPYRFKAEVLELRNLYKRYLKLVQLASDLESPASKKWRHPQDRSRKEVVAEANRVYEELYDKAQEARAKGVSRAMILSIGQSMRSIMGVNFQEQEKPKASCCLKCHFKYEEDNAFSSLPPHLKKRLELEHAILKKSGYPKDDVLKHARKEELIFEKYCSSEVCQKVKKDHLTFGRGEMEFCASCDEKLAFVDENVQIARLQKLQAELDWVIDKIYRNNTDYETSQQEKIAINKTLKPKADRILIEANVLRRQIGYPPINPKGYIGRAMEGDREAVQDLTMKFQESLLSREEEHELIQRAQAGDQNARNKLLSKNVGLVKSIAQYYGNSSNRDEFISAGNTGLLKAIKKFDLKQPVKFSTYATPWIKREMGRYKIFLSKMHPLSEGYDVAEKSKPEAPVSKAVLNGILLMMPPREADILKRRLAIEPYHEPQTLKEIGLHYKVSQERIRQIEKVALAKMKAKLKEADPDLHFSEILKLSHFWK